MKLYSTGLMGFIATIAALVANVELYEKFNVTQPYVFWGGQIVLCVIFLAIGLYSFLHWDEKASVKKMRFALSVFICMCMYAIAYTGSKYAFMLILAIGVIEVFLTRKRFGLVKK